MLIDLTQASQDEPMADIIKTPPRQAARKTPTAPRRLAIRIPCRSAGSSVSRRLQWDDVVESNSPTMSDTTPEAAAERDVDDKDREDREDREGREALLMSLPSTVVPAEAPKATSEMDQLFPSTGKNDFAEISEYHPDDEAWYDEILHQIVASPKERANKAQSVVIESENKAVVANEPAVPLETGFEEDEDESEIGAQVPAESQATAEVDAWQENSEAGPNFFQFLDPFDLLAPLSPVYSHDLGDLADLEDLPHLGGLEDLEEKTEDEFDSQFRVDEHGLPCFDDDHISGPRKRQRVQW